MTRDDVVRLIAVIKGLWPGWSSAPGSKDALTSMAAVWLPLLSDIHPDVAAAAVQALAADGREFPPAVGQIRRRAVELASPSLPGADEAWTEIQQGVQRYGLNAGPPAWSHPTITDTVQALGWRDLCLSTNPDTIRAHFLRLWPTIVNRAERDRFTPPAAAALRPLAHPELAQVTP